MVRAAPRPTAARPERTDDLGVSRGSSVREDGFERRALEHLDAVHRLLLRLTRDPHEAADLTQDTFLRAFRSADTFRDQGGGLRPWLFTIAHNAFITRRKREARAPIPVERVFEADPGAVAPGDPPPAWGLASLDWEHVDDRLKGAIDALPDEQRAPLLLWGVEGLKYREIAAILDVPLGTVMSRLHRARKALADALEHCRDDLARRTDSPAGRTEQTGPADDSQEGRAPPG